MKVALLPFAFFLSVVVAKPDVLVLRNGQVLNGKVLQQDAKGVLFKLEYGTFNYPKASFKQVQIDAAGNSGNAESTLFPNWGAIITEFAKQKWATSVRQIPATVIDTGILKHVPYMSFQAASGGYELNIYGDPDHPAGFELGVRSYLLDKAEAKSNCVAFVSLLLNDEAEGTIVRQLNWAKDSSSEDGVTFEITPPSDPDAYGGWWISIYSEEMLDATRASENELTAISQPFLATKYGNQYGANGTFNRDPGLNQEPSGTQDLIWSKEDLNSARRLPSSPSYSTGGGRVFVKGYYRKDGTYVRPHTRSAPRR